MGSVQVGTGDNREPFGVVICIASFPARPRAIYCKAGDDGNYRNRRELLLRHEYNGLDLKLDRAADTLANVQHIWGQPVHLQTVVKRSRLC